MTFGAGVVEDLLAMFDIATHANDVAVFGDDAGAVASGFEERFGACGDGGIGVVKEPVARTGVDHGGFDSSFLNGIE